MVETTIFQVCDINHVVVRQWQDPPEDAFLRFCRRAEKIGVRYVDFIWEYSDAMLNFFQLQAWLEDFPKALETGKFSEAEEASATAALAGAREALEIAGYLFLKNL